MVSTPITSFISERLSFITSSFSTCNLSIVSLLKKHSIKPLNISSSAPAHAWCWVTWRHSQSNWFDFLCWPVTLRKLLISVSELITIGSPDYLCLMETFINRIGLAIYKFEHHIFYFNFIIKNIFITKIIKLNQECSYH